MSSEQFQCAICIHDHCQPTQLGLIAYGAYDPSLGEAVDNKGRNTYLIELLRSLLLDGTF